MKLVAQVKLSPTHAQAEALEETLTRANAACETISRFAFQRRGGRPIGRFALQRELYHPLRASTGLPAQVLIRCLAKVAAAYQRGAGTLRRFAPRGALAFDDRNLTWHVVRGAVSISTTRGRQMVPFEAGARQRELLSQRRGEADLVWRAGVFYLLATCEVPIPEPQASAGYLGVDLGVVNIATDSDGKVWAPRGSHINTVRGRHRRLRSKLQRIGTPSAQRKLRRRARREARHARAVNHWIAKQLVARAQGTGRGIALEDLGGIRERVKVGRRQRAKLHSWSFGQLRAFIAYKAQRAGVAVVVVDAAYTSQTCPGCGHVARGNRRSQERFDCVRCGFAGHADMIAACNIARRAEVNRPNVPIGGSGNFQSLSRRCRHKLSTLVEGS